MKNKILILLLGILLFSGIGIASAEINNYAPVKQNDCVILSQVCSSCSFVNISIKYPSPNSSYAIYEESMTRIGGGDWFYEFCNTTLIGRYDVTGHGDLEGVDTGFDVLFFEVTPNGSVLSIELSIMYVFILLILIGLFLFGISKTSSSIKNIKTDSMAWTVFYICISYLSIFALSFILWLISNDYLYSIPILASIMWILWITLGIMFFPFIIVLGGYLLKKQAEALMVDEYVSQGYTRKESLDMSKRRR